MRHLRALLVGLLLGTSLTLVTACDKDKAKPEETKKSEPVPLPSDLVFNDFLPATGNATGLGVRDSGLEGGLGDVGGNGSGGEPGGPGPAEASPEKLKVVEPGAEPRSLRKYSFVVNRTDKRVVTITQAVSQTVGGQPAGPSQEVTLKLYLDLTPKQVKPAGATIELKLTKVELPGTPPQAAAALASLSGLSGTFGVTARGEVGEVSFVAGQQLKNQLAETVIQGLSQAVQLFLVPFPEAPIGTGAKWELGMRSDQGESGTKRFALKEASNDSAVVESDIEIKVPRRAQQAPRGGTVFVSVDEKAKYAYQSRFDRMATKVEGEVAVNESIEVNDPKQGGKQTIVQAQKSKHLIEPAK